MRFLLLALVVFIGAVTVATAADERQNAPPRTAPAGTVAARVETLEAKVSILQSNIETLRAEMETLKMRP